MGSEHKQLGLYAHRVLPRIKYVSLTLHCSVHENKIIEIIITGCLKPAACISSLE